MRRRNFVLVSIVVLSVSVSVLPAGTVRAGGGGCHGPSSPRQAGGSEVVLEASCFAPNVLLVEAGTEVTFTNHDPVAHAVHGAGFEWGAAAQLNTSDTASFVFDRPGTFAYSCYIHPGMTGAIVVGDGRAAESAVAISEVRRAEPAAVSAAQPPEPQAPAAAAPTLEAESSDDQPLFAVLGALAGGVAVAVAFSARRIRRG